MSDQPGTWIRYDPTFDTERNTREAAQAASDSNERLAIVAEAMAVQVELTKASLASAEQTERFTRRMTWASLIVSVASLVAAVAAIVVSVSLGGS